MITKPLPGFTNQRPIGKPICLHRTPEPTGCICCRKDTYVHFFSWGKTFMQRIWGEESTGRLFLTVIIMMIVRTPSFTHPRPPINCAFGETIILRYLQTTSTERWNAFHSSKAFLSPFSLVMTTEECKSKRKRMLNGTWLFPELVLK